MIKPLSLFIGLRYTGAKQRNHFISFISTISILGIALGVTALITVLSVMNGFEKEISAKLLGMVSHINIYQYGGRPVSDWQTLARQAEKVDTSIIASAPFTQGQAMISQNNQITGLLLEGVIPEYESHITDIHSKIIAGELDSLNQPGFNIIIGQTLAANLGLQLGDMITIVLPETSVSVVGVMPRFKRFKITGLFKIDTQYDKSVAFIHSQKAGKLFYKDSQQVTGVKLKLDNVYAAPRLSNSLDNALPSQYLVRDWTFDHGNYFQAIKLEKTIMFLMLLLIVAVAAFNIVSALVMVVTDKRAEIAILRTIGATPRLIMQVFMFQGAIVGLIGTALGLVGGVLLALNVTDIIAYIEELFKVQFLSSDVYYISFLPSELQWPDVVKICIVSLILCFIATLYPAWRASKIKPAETLRYE